MQAARAAEGPKVLRLGVIEGSRILEERVLRSRDAVSVGTTEHNTFVLSAEGVPAHFELFTLAGGQYRLNFTEAMEGRVALTTGVHTLAELRAAGRAQRTNTGWQLALTDSTRGKVVLGAVSLLFQFVPPPPAMVRPQLPVAIRARRAQNMDWGFNASLAFFLTLAFGAVSYVEYGYDPEVEDDFAVISAPAITALIQPSVVEPPPPPPPAQGAEAPAPPEPTATTPAPGPHNPSPTRQPSRTASNNTPMSQEQRDQQAIDRALTAATRASDAALAALGRANFALIAAGSDPNQSAVARVANGGIMQQGVEALANVGGITNRGSDVARRGQAPSAGPAGGPIGHGHLIASNGANIGTNTNVAPEVGPRGTVRLATIDAPSGDGRLSNDLIGQTIRRNIGGIQQCYTMALRNHPSLRGRLEATFTIGTSGRVAGTPSTDGMREAPEVGTCVANRLRFLVFPQPADGSVETTIPFNFEPGR